MAGWFGQLRGEQDGGWSRDPVRVTAELSRSIAAGSQEPGLDVFASRNIGIIAIKSTELRKYC